MHIEISKAYESAKTLLEQLRNMNKGYAEALDKKGEAEINFDSVVALVTSEKEMTGVSKTALKDLVKGDERVLEAKAQKIRADIEVKKAEARVEYVEKAHDLEKKRMSAEMEEAKRFDYNQ